MTQSLALTTKLKHRSYAVLVLAADGFRVGTLTQVPHVREGSTKKVLRWAAKCSPMAFCTSGRDVVPEALYRPVPGSDYLPGRHHTQQGAQAELEAYLREHDAPGLGA